jgi:dihydroorotate dehydrogenase
MLSDYISSLPQVLRDLRDRLAELEGDAARTEARRLLDTVGQGPFDTESGLHVLNQVMRLCVQGGRRDILAAHRIPHPVYDTLATVQENLAGPREAGHPGSAPGDRRWHVLGFEVGFPLGVAASMLTANARWVSYYARRGFNVLTYKTVRSHRVKAHPPPNWIFLEGSTVPFSPEAIPDRVREDSGAWPADPRAFSMANSVGIPSEEPRVWQADLADALGRLAPHQLLVASVTGSPERYQGQELTEDFVRVSRMAEEAGAPAIELNLACPNTADPGRRAMMPPICRSPATVVEIVRAVRDGLRDETRLLAKVSYLDRESVERILLPLGSCLAGITGISTLQMRVVTRDGRPPFIGTSRDPREERREAGVSGVAIRNLALEFVRRAAELGRRLGVEVIGIGGVMTAADVVAFLDAGAVAVQSVTAAFFNPDLASDVAHSLLEVRSSGELDGTLDSESRL